MYTQAITRKHRSVFILLIDRSASMQERVCMGNRLLSKAQALTIIANNFLRELIDRCRRTDTLRDYYDIAVMGYGDDKVEMLLGHDQLIPITKLAERPTIQHRMCFEIKQEDGNFVSVGQQMPIWFEPKAEGNTPMYEAMLKAKQLVAEWCAKDENRQSFPPIVLNISDGEITDGSRKEWIDITTQLRREATLDGNALLLNIHLSADNNVSSLIFPTQEELRGANKQALLMAETSSLMPPVFNEDICSMKQANTKPPFIGMGYNAHLIELISAINIGSRSGPALQ